MMVEAVEQQLLLKGLFVPTGLHLIKSSEVVYNLLTEQKAFLQKVTSVQLDGISTTEMYKQDKEGRNIEQILFEGPGVHTIEKIYQTNYRGSWLLIVDGTRLQELNKYITENVQEIYKHKKGKKTKLVGTQQNKYLQGYQLMLIDIKLSKVGTYAEVLRSRFTKKQDTKTVTQSTPHQGNPSKSRVPRNIKEYIKPLSSASTLNKGIEDSPGETINAKHNSTEWPSLPGKPPSATNGGSQTTKSAHLANVSSVNRQPQQQASQQGSTAVRQELQDAKTSLEEMFQKKMEEIKLQNQEMIKKTQTQIDKKSESIFKQKIMAASGIMADVVSKRIMKQLNGFMSNHNKKNEDQKISSINTEVIMQESPVKQSRSDIYAPDLPINSNAKDNQDTTNNTMIMEALKQIEQDTHPSDNSIHDTTSKLYCDHT